MPWLQHQAGPRIRPVGRSDGMNDRAIFGTAPVSDERRLLMRRVLRTLLWVALAAVITGACAGIVRQRVMVQLEHETDVDVRHALALDPADGAAVTAQAGLPTGTWLGIIDGSTVRQELTLLAGERGRPDPFSGRPDPKQVDKGAQAGAIFDSAQLVESADSRAAFRVRARRVEDGMLYVAAVPVDQIDEAASALDDALARVWGLAVLVGLLLALAYALLRPVRVDADGDGALASGAAPVPIPADEPRREPLQLAGVVRTATDAEDIAELDLDDTVTVHGDAALLTQLVRELVTGANSVSVRDTAAGAELAADHDRATSASSRARARELASSQDVTLVTSVGRDGVGERFVATFPAAP